MASNNTLFTTSSSHQVGKQPDLSEQYPSLESEDGFLFSEHVFSQLSTLEDPGIAQAQTPREHGSDSSPTGNHHDHMRMTHLKELDGLLDFHFDMKQSTLSDLPKSNDSHRQLPNRGQSARHRISSPEVKLVDPVYSPTALAAFAPALQQVESCTPAAVGHRGGFANNVGAPRLGQPQDFLNDDGVTFNQYFTAEPSETHVYPSPEVAHQSWTPSGIGNNVYGQIPPMYADEIYGQHVGNNLPTYHHRVTPLDQLQAFVQQTLGQVVPHDSIVFEGLHETHAHAGHADALFDDFSPGLPPLSGLPLKPGPRSTRTAPPAITDCPEARCKRRGKINDENPTGFCRRHLEKYQRNHAPTPTFTFPAGINSQLNAHDHVYPWLIPLHIEGDDVPASEDVRTENRYVEQFIKAAMQPYDEQGDYFDFHSRQQKVFNGKRYKDIEVNARMRLLYGSVMIFHHGGKPIYPEGGDNAGYGKPERSLKFSDRVNKIIEVMKTDKRVVMDVVEGRGVGALVGSPEKYERRKTQNKDSNERKQKKQQLGDRIQAKRKAKGKSSHNSDVDSDDFSGSDEESDVEDSVAATPALDMLTPASMGVPLDMETPVSQSSPPVQVAGSKRKRATKSITPGSSAVAAVPKAKRQQKTKAAKKEASDQQVAPVAAMHTPHPDETFGFGLDEGYHAGSDTFHSMLTKELTDHAAFGFDNLLNSP